jgi:4-amino-4-deoxy-L-arabinose transferase-like glycosyltransferase
MGRSNGGLCGKIGPLFWSPWAMVVAALALRLAVMCLTYKIQLDPSQDHLAFGWETGRVARSIVNGEGFSSPYSVPTGPTALIPPVYPYLVAGVFKLFGIYTAPSALILLTLNNLFSSFTCLPVFLIARKVFGLHVAVWAGWTWVIFPYSIGLSNTVIWETSFTTLLLTLVVLATLYLEKSNRPVDWIAYGSLWGFTGLTSPATLSVLPFLGGWIWIRHWSRGSKVTGLALAASLAFFAIITPWIWRCSQTNRRFVAFRDNFALEVLVGNSDNTSRPANWSLLPASNPSELERLRQVGEPAYMAEKQQQAKELIERNPSRYALLTLRRILNTWTAAWEYPSGWNMNESGLANILLYSLISLLAFAGIGRSIRDQRDAVYPLSILVVVFPAIYYLTHSDLGFRHPIDPVIVIFLIYGISPQRSKKAQFLEQDTFHDRIEESGQCWPLNEGRGWRALLLQHAICDSQSKINLNRPGVIGSRFSPEM